MRILTYLILSSLCFALSAQQMGKQSLTQLKESTAGARIILFLDAVSSGSLSEGSIDNLFSPKLIDKIGLDRLNTAFGDILENDGSLVLYKAIKLKDTEYKLEAKGVKSKEWLEMKFYFDDKSEYRIIGFTTDTVNDGDDSLKPMYPISN